MSDAARPRSVAALFFAFNSLALQGFGGVLPVAQRVIVERRGWLAREQFLEALSVAQVLPGPNIVNLALMIGDRFFGWRGAAAATAGLLVAPLAIVIAAAALYGHYATLPAVAGALRGMGAVAAGLVVATALRLAPALARNPMGVPACTVFAAATALLVGGLRWPLAWVMLGLGAVAVAFAWSRLGRR